MKSRLVTLYYYLTLIFLTLLISILCLLFVIYTQFKRSFEADIPVSFEYQFSSFNTETNETIFGFVSIPRLLENDEFIYYRSENNVVANIISRVSDNEYRCYGTCTCAENMVKQERRLNRFKPYLFFLFSAFSLIAALSFAKKHFQEQCELTIPECPQDSIESNIEICEKNEVEGIHKVEEKDSDSDSDSVEFLCYGRCLNKKEGKVGCEQNTLEKTIAVKIPHEFVEDAGFKYMKKVAINDFTIYHMKPFCVRISIGSKEKCIGFNYRDAYSNIACRKK